MVERESSYLSNNIQKVEEMESVLGIENEDIEEPIPLETRVKNIARRIFEDPTIFYISYHLPDQIRILHAIISPTSEENFSTEDEV